jgi:3-oxoacyl-[acyl-carrier protein] reductase
VIIKGNLSMQSRLSNKVAFVTGGARGIGAAIVRRLASEGATVAFTYQSSAASPRKLAADIATRTA